MRRLAAARAGRHLDMSSTATHNVMQNENSSTSRSLHLLSELLLGGDLLAAGPSALPLASELPMLSNWGDDELARFLTVADLHHVLVRALEALQLSPAGNLGPRVSSLFAAALTTERARIARALGVLETICRELESAGCSAIVIKSLDHSPDLGSDLDLYTGGPEDLVVSIMTKRLAAEVLPRSWGDRLAHKWNFRLPNLPEAVEIHAGCLGQTGEHLNLARQVSARAVRREVGGYSFRVPALEERVIITTLQRMYRHWYCRLCDIVDTTKLIQTQALDYARLRMAAEAGGIWPGVATFLVIVAEYARTYGTALTLPADVVASAPYRDNTLQLRGDFLRIPIVPQAARLFLRQVLHAAHQKDLRTVSRLALLPSLAAAALVAYKVTGSDKGIW